MPFTQKKTWKTIQFKDPIHCKLRQLIESRQLPETKKTKGDNTKLKLLHNLYTQGKLTIDKDLVLVKTPEGYYNGNVISVPPAIFPGIANAIHIRLDHPSREQLAGIISRYFYTPGWRSILDDVSNSCPQCASVRRLPKVLLEDSSSQSETVGSKFAADVIEREGQRILTVRECTSQFTRAMLIPDQKADTLRNALITMVLDIIPDTGTSIRVDGATGFQQLERESTTNNSTLKKLGIKIVLGRLLNKNKNPVAENAVQEIHKEILRLKNSEGPITDTELMIILKNINNRVRYHSKTPKEILFRRNALSNVPINVDDEHIISSQKAHRTTSSKHSQKHKEKSKSRTPMQTFQRGDLVLLRDVHSKSSPRDTFIVEELPREDSKFLLIRKLKQQLRPRLYRALPDELIHSPATPVQSDSPNPGRKKRKAALIAREKIQSMMNIKSLPQKCKQTKFKPGWRESDQEDDLYLPIIPYHNSEDEDYDPTSNSSSRRDSDASITSSASLTSEDELDWDPTPEQITIQSATYDASPQNPSQVSTKKINVIPPPFTRNRIPAFTRPPLRRQPAFRSVHPNHAFVAIPQTLTDPVPPPTPKKRSRIPLPTSPSKVVLNQVNDISFLPRLQGGGNHTPDLRRSARISSRANNVRESNRAHRMKEEERMEDREVEDGTKNTEAEDGTRGTEEEEGIENREVSRKR